LLRKKKKRKRVLERVWEKGKTRKGTEEKKGNWENRLGGVKKGEDFFLTNPVPIQMEMFFFAERRGVAIIMDGGEERKRWSYFCNRKKGEKYVGQGRLTSSEYVERGFFALCTQGNAKK